jgi:hypothetical protein
MDTVGQIEWAKREIAALPGSLQWRESVLRQLEFCNNVLAGAVPPERLEDLNMGYIAVRELDGVEPLELSRAIAAIQYELQQQFLSFAAKVRLGIHHRT